MARKTKTYKAGDRVGYSRKFCKSIGASPTDTCWRDKGTVIRMKKLGNRPFVSVAWDYDPDEPKLVHPDAVAKVGSVRYVD